MVSKTAADLRPHLERGGVPLADIEEVVSLLERPPERTSIAVVGPQNAGKSTLIAVLTGSAEALEDVGPTIATDTSHGYRYSNGDTEFELWDTPGLETEQAEHDAEARDRITKADAVIVTMTPDLVSDRGRARLAELLQAGRKRGAVLPVVTKADREPLENRPGITLSVRAALPNVDREPVFVAARRVLDDQREDAPIRAETGIPEFREELERLATGEARRRLELTAAIRLVNLIEAAEDEVAAAEPESRRALLFQRRLGRILLRAQRRVDGMMTATERRLRHEALVATNTIGAALDKRCSREQLELKEEEAWQSFIGEIERAERSLPEDVDEQLATASQELERLDQGELAEHLREIAAELEMGGPDRPADAELFDAEQARRALELADMAAKAVRLVPDGRARIVGEVADVAADVGAIVVDEFEADAIDTAKLEIRKQYLERADTQTEVFQDWLEGVKIETTEAAWARCKAVEDELHASLGDVHGALEHLSSRRRRLDDFISAQLKLGYEADS